VRKSLGSLTKNVAIYGAGDVAVKVVGLLLLPLYIIELSDDDFGALGLLIGVEAFAKIVFRWGLDGAFMRYYHDRKTAEARRLLTSTLCWFLLVTGSVLLAVGLIGSDILATRLFGEAAGRYVTALRLVLINTFLLTFTFVPYQVMRLEGRAVTFTVLSFARSTATVVLKFVLVIAMGMGLTGYMVTDLVVTVALLPWLWPFARPLIGRAFSREELRRCLRFGLPRLPHGLAQQALDAGNKILFNRYVPLSSLGVYQISGTVGQSLKLFLSAFETGWAPFYYENAHHSDARVTFSKITTYGIAILVLLVSGLVAIAPDLVRAITWTEPWSAAAYAQAAIVVPLVGAGIAFQGVYLLTSIGLNLTSQTQYYPVATFAAAGVGLGGGLLLMPGLGATGAALAFALSYVTLAVVAGYFAQRHYPMTYERGRISRALLAGIAAGAAGWLLPAMPPVAGVLVRGATTVLAFGGLLWIGGFLRHTERVWLADQSKFWLTRRANPSDDDRP